MMSIQQFLPKKFLGFLPLYVGVELVLGISALNKISGFYGLLALFTGHPLDFFQCLYYLSSVVIVPFYISMLRNLSIALPSSPVRFKASTINKISFLTVLYCVDTVVSLLFTVYFSWFWFSGTAEQQDSDVSNDIADNIQAAAGALQGESAQKGTAAQATQDTSYKSTDYYKRDVVVLGLGLALQLIAARAAQTDGSEESASTTYEMFFTVSSIIVVSVIRIYFTLILLSFARTLIKAAKYNSVTEDEDDDQNLDTSFLDGNIFQRKLRQLEMMSANILKGYFA